MPNVDPARYRAAQERVASGKWTVNPSAGLVYGRGGPIGMLGSTGYIRLCLAFEGRQVTLSAHRVIWEYVLGPIPPGLEINHINGCKTDNRISNLELATRVENQMHAIATGLQPPSPIGEDSPNARLNEAQVADIFRRKRNGESTGTLAAEFGVSRGIIVHIDRGREWTHVTLPIAAELGLKFSFTPDEERRLRPHGERVRTAKLTDAQYAEILQRAAAAGERVMSIARRFPAVSRSAISHYIKRHRTAA